MHIVVDMNDQEPYRSQELCREANPGLKKARPRAREAFAITEDSEADSHPSVTSFSLVRCSTCRASGNIMRTPKISAMLHRDDSSLTVLA